MRSRFKASAPAKTKLGAAKRAGGDIDHCLGSRRLRGVIASWPAAAFWCEPVAPTSNVCWSRCLEARSACPRAGEHYLQSHIESKAERVAADGRPLGRGGVTRSIAFGSVLAGRLKACV